MSTNKHKFWKNRPISKMHFGKSVRQLSFCISFLRTYMTAMIFWQVGYSVECQSTQGNAVILQL